MRGKTAPMFWIALTASALLAILKAFGLYTISWWIVPYPILSYLSFLSIVMIAVSGSTMVYIRNRIKNQKEDA